MSAIEAHLLDPGGQRLFGNRFANGLSRCFASAVLDAIPQAGIERAYCAQRFALIVIDHLAANVFMAARDRQPRAFRRAMHSVSNTVPASCAPAI